MKKSCQLYKLLFCIGDEDTRCTLFVATRLFCTKMEHRFGALRFG
ncbi:hypothetical protein ENTCAN_07835 [Enterobacter cancerogenus ATCC 35316]|nr:hypothetical protein ENTCAN_07835 [Enterobacter cancerogenus ATCC 35316]